MSFIVVPDSPTFGIKISTLHDRLHLRTTENRIEDPTLVPLFSNFPSVAYMDRLDLSLRFNSGDIKPTSHVEIANQTLTLDVKADVWKSLMLLASSFSDGKASPPQVSPTSTVGDPIAERQDSPEISNIDMLGIWLHQVNDFSL